MKILWLSHLVPYPPKAGVLLRSYNLLREVARVHDVDLLTFVQEDFFRQIYDDPEVGKREAMAHLESLCGRVAFVPIDGLSRRHGKLRLAMSSLFSTAPYTINWLRSSRFGELLDAWMDDGGYDVVHFDTISLDPYRGRIGRTASVLNHHNIESHLMLRRASQEANPLKRFYYFQEGWRLERYERRVCGRYATNVVCSALDAERLRGIDPGLSPRVIPNGVDIDYFRPSGMPDAGRSIVFVGTLNWEPNRKAVLYLVEEILPVLRRRAGRVTCHIVGAHPPAALEAAARNDPDLKVHGFVQDVRDHIGPGRVFVCPIKDGGGTKLKLLDAFAMQCAVVADPVACEGIEVEDGAHVLLAETPDDYCRAIMRLFEDERLRSGLGERARRLVESGYSYDSIGREMSALFEAAAKQGGAT